MSDLNLQSDIVGIGSFGGNGQSDILFHNASGQNLIWVVQNDQLVGGYSLPQTPTSWSVAGVGDFTGSGTDGTLHQVSPRFPSSGLCGLFGGLRPSS
jgi:hypothetical protein